MNSVQTEPYHPAYFLVNGRSMPDDMDPNYAVQYPHQPYNGNPHMHPGEITLVREIGHGRWQHPLHEHGNHLRLLARDGNLLLSPEGALAGPLLFTTTSTPGQALDALFYWTGKGLNWDVFGHGYRQRHERLHPGCERVLHQRSDGAELLRVVPRSQQAARKPPVRQRRQPAGR